MQGIPLGNSKFQIEKLIVNEFSPARKARTILLQLNEKLSALKEFEFNNKRWEIDKLEKQSLFEKSENNFEKQRLQVDIEEINYRQEHSQKFVDDCIEEVKIYKELLAKIPVEYTREMFETEEQGYWEKRFINDAQAEILAIGTVQKDTLQSLKKIGVYLKQNKKGQISFVKMKELEDKNDKISINAGDNEMAGNSNKS